MFYKYLKKIAYRSRGIVRRDKTNDSDVKFNPKEREWWYYNSSNTIMTYQKSVYLKYYIILVKHVTFITCQDYWNRCRIVSMIEREIKLYNGLPGMVVKYSNVTYFYVQTISRSVPLLARGDLIIMNVVTYPSPDPPALFRRWSSSDWFYDNFNCIN